MSLRNLDRWVRAVRDDVRALEVPQDLEERFGGFWDDPVGFVREILGADPEPYQVGVLDACVVEPRIAFRSGHGVGKTTTLAWVLLWWLLTRPFSRVLILAPAFERQVGRFVLPEVRKWVRNAPKRLPVKVGAMTVEVGGFEREWFAVGVSAANPDLVEGGHAESLLVIGDEAKGLGSDVIAALHGTQTDVGGDRLYLLASVPGGPSGPFYDAFRGEAWRTFHVSCLDSRRVSPEWIDERRTEWGEGSPLYQSRVLGEFPEEDEATLFRLSDLEAAQDGPLSGVEDPITIGVDPARFGGDRSVLAVWRGKELLSVESRQGWDLMRLASWVASEVNRHNPAFVRIDEIGVGAGVVDRLHQMGHGMVVEGVAVSRKATRPDLYANTRAEMFWRLREALERHEVRLPRDDTLIGELSAFRFGYSTMGQILLERKEETRARIGRSPDLADAVALGFPVGTQPVRYQPIFLARIGGEDVETRLARKRLRTLGAEPALDPGGQVSRRSPWRTME